MFDLFALSRYANQTDSSEIKLSEINYNEIVEESKKMVDDNEDNNTPMPSLEPDYITLEHAVLYDSLKREFYFKEPDPDTSTYRHGVTFFFRSKENEDYKVVNGVIPFYSPELCDYNVQLIELNNNNNNTYYYTSSSSSLSVYKSYSIHKLEIMPFPFTEHTSDKIIQTLRTIYDEDPSVVFTGTMSYPAYCMTQTWNSYRSLHKNVPDNALKWLLKERELEKKQIISRPDYKMWTPSILNSPVLCGYWVLLECPILLQYFPLNVLSTLSFDEICLLHDIIDKCEDISELFLKPISISSIKQINPISFVYVLSNNSPYYAKEIFQKIVLQYGENAYRMMMCIWLRDCLYQDLVLSKGNTIHKCGHQDYALMWWNKLSDKHKLNDDGTYSPTDSEFGLCHNLGKKMLKQLFPEKNIPDLAQVASKLVPFLVDMESLTVIDQKNIKTGNPERFIALTSRYNISRKSCEFLIEFRDKPNLVSNNNTITTQPKFIKPIDQYDYISFDKEQRIAAHLVETDKGRVHFWSGNGGSGKSFLAGCLAGDDAVEVEDNNISNININTAVAVNFKHRETALTKFIDDKIRANDNNNVIKFYKETDIPYGVFCNFSLHPIIINNVRYNTVEHYYQSEKETNLQYKELIKNTSTPGKSKILANRDIMKLTPEQERGSYRWRKELNDIITKYKNVGGKRKDWNEVRDDIMYKGLYAKFTQNESCKKILLDTKDAILIENSPIDSYWGIGSNNKGENKLGQLLMKLRSELVQQSQNNNNNNKSFMTDNDDDLFVNIDIDTIVNNSNTKCKNNNNNSMTDEKNDMDNNDDHLFANIDLDTIINNSNNKRKSNYDNNNNNNNDNTIKRIKLDEKTETNSIIEQQGKLLEKQLNEMKGKPATILRFAPFNTQKNNLIDTIGFAYTVASFNTIAKFGAHDLKLRFSEVHTVLIDELGVESEAELYEFLLNLQKLPKLERIIGCGDVYQLPSIAGGNVLQDFLECRLFNVTFLINNHRVDPDAKELFQIVKQINKGQTAFVPFGPGDVNPNLKCFQLREHNLQIFERACEYSKQYYEEMAEKILKDPINVQGIAFSNNWCDWLNLKIKEKAGWMKQGLSGSNAENSIIREYFSLADDEYVPSDCNNRIQLEDLTKRKVKNQVRFKKNDNMNYLKNDDLHVFEKIILLGRFNYRIPDWLKDKEPHLQTKYVLENNTLGIIRKIVSYNNKYIHEPPKEYNNIAYLPNQHANTNIIYIQLINKKLQKICKERFPNEDNPHLLLKDEKQWIPFLWKDQYIERIFPAYWITTYRYQSLQAKTILHVIEYFTTRKSLTTTVGRASKEYICYNVNKKTTVYEQFKKAIQKVEPERVTLLKVVLAQLYNKYHNNNNNIP